MPQEQLSCMSEALQHMGPDKHEEHMEGQVFFGRHMFWTTPESYQESFPAQDPAQRVRVNFNGRIDYREELLEKMGLPPSDLSRWSDPEYVALAYLHFGRESFLQHLYGDFVFALWDAENEELLLAKDRTGFKGLFYHEDEKAVYFASTLRALRQVLPTTGYEDKYLVDYITGNTQESNLTLYKTLHRVQVCHYVTFRSNKNAKRVLYYQYHLGKKLDFASDADYYGKFRDLLDAAVKERSRSVAPLAASLSGGLDSSTVCFLLRDYLPKEQDRLITYSQVQNDKKSPKDEPYIDEALASGFFESNKSKFDYTAFEADFLAAVKAADEPTNMYNLGISSQQWKKAAKRGVRVYMEGFGGDMFVPYGHELLAYRIKRLELGKILKQQRFSKEHTYMSSISLASVLIRFGKFWLKAALGNLGYWFYQRKKSKLGGEFKHRVDQNYRRKYLEGRLTGRQQFLASVRTFIGSKDFINLETLVKNFAPVEVACPFYDVKFIEFMLAVPDGFHNKHFVPRYFYRESLKGLLPEKILQRSSKGQFSEIVKLCRRYDDAQKVYAEFPWLRTLFNLAKLKDNASYEWNSLIATRFFLEYHGDAQHDKITSYGEENRGLHLFEANT